MDGCAAEAGGEALMEKLGVRTVEQEWVNLMSEAKQLGISIQEIRVFLSLAQQGERKEA